MAFVPLHIHTEYSLLESFCRIKPLVQQAKAAGMKALAITDKANMYGVIPFYRACQQEGIQPIIGLEVSFLLQPLLSPRDQPVLGTLLLYARNETGYRNLLKISSTIMSHETTPWLQKDTLLRYCEGLLAISAGVEGEVQQLLLRQEVHTALETVRYYKEIFSSYFYLGIEDHGHAKEGMLNETLVSFSKEADVALCVTHETYFLHEEEAAAYDVLLAIKEGTKIDDDQRRVLPSDRFYFASEEEVTETFAAFPEALAQTEQIAALCHVTLTFDEQLIPRYPLPEHTETSHYLRHLCEEGALARYGELTERVRKRLTYELDIITNMKFADYFLIVWDFMRFAHEQGILTGPGRGSAAGSLVAYLLEITDVDPLAHDLLFERFLNPERVSMPDIDIDFPDIHRDEVLQYVKRKYGQEQVAQIITFGTLAAKAALRDTARALNVESTLVDQLSKQIPSQPGMTLQRALQESYGLKNLLESSNEAATLFQTALVLEGLPRHASTHAAGVIISAGPLTEHTPLQRGHDGIYLTQYSMEWLEALGLLKMDFLGLRNLTLLENITERIREGTGEQIVLASIPFHDEKTFALLGRGETSGIFQLESDGMRRVLQQLKPTEFEDIVAVNALYRPGPMQNISSYIEGKHGTKPVHYLHEALQPILQSTYGVIVYQEQIMKIASEIAGFSLGEADLLRRAVSKKKRDVLDQERKHFVAGCLAKGYEEHIAHELYDLIVRFADYGFNRSHAVSYSIISYQLAYLKANYPLYFMAALLSSVAGNPDKVAQYVRECKDQGISVLPPSITKSEAAFTVEDSGIRFGLFTVKNAGNQAIQQLLEARALHPFSDLFDVCSALGGRQLHRRMLESLIFAGACDEWGRDRASLLASLDEALSYGERMHDSKEEGQFGLFREGESLTKPNYVDVPPFEEAERLKFEREVLGFYLSGHPVEKYRPSMKRYGLAPISHVKESAQRTLVRIGILITNARVIKTKKGEQMAFLTGSDESGEMEFVVFPQAFKAHYRLLQKGALLIVEGRVEHKNEGKQVILEKATSLLDAASRPEPKKETLYLKIDEDSISAHKLQHVKELLEHSEGSTPVILYYERQNKTVKIGHSIAATTKLLSAITALLGDGNVVLKGN
ncbi:DNA polymerase III DnaE [Fictibacillus macauensis ZFHKF-1]|uniref:DNA polymerase III subunit alpha n=1 Tax=Fictibacillus macauensis ZFHKF-1 TaxID=1196324 RepID=I8J151_9BACL|nr:DNA polymerase III subunit alpha [Fictibacillus macauensis]EIT85446.1 DNA polymerase III DnaE [Fictibacillus macauensis ZFHKF-1]